MITSLLRNKLVLVGIIVVVLGFGWYGLSSSPTSDSALTSTGVIDNTAGSSDIVKTLLALQSITLKGAILSDPAFTTLRDFTTAIIPVSIGRPNPFAPITDQSAPSSATTKSTHIFQPAR